jgi:hypothetical protein
LRTLTCLSGVDGARDAACRGCWVGGPEEKQVSHFGTGASSLAPDNERLSAR